MRFRELEEELDRRLKQASELENQLKYSLSELELLKDSQEQRLGRIFPAELLSSEVGESVRWSSEAATQQDFIATAVPFRFPARPRGFRAVVGLSAHLRQGFVQDGPP
jgi:hypothetical protein